jgi:hypothetical protein
MERADTLNTDAKDAKEIQSWADGLLLVIWLQMSEERLLSALFPRICVLCGPFAPFASVFKRARRAAPRAAPKTQSLHMATTSRSIAPTRGSE